MGHLCPPMKHQTFAKLGHRFHEYCLQKIKLESISGYVWQLFSLVISKSAQSSYSKVMNLFSHELGHALHCYEWCSPIWSQLGIVYPVWQA
jgi:hypothetical protein